MIMVDSSVWIDYFNGTRTTASTFLDDALGTQYLVIGDLILTEVLQGFKSDKDFNKARSLMAAFEVHNLMSEHLAVQSAKNFRFLRKRGLTVRKTIDVIIATYCIDKDIPLLHSDRDFQPFAKHLKLRSVFP